MTCYAALAGYEIGCCLVIVSCCQKLLDTLPSSALLHTTVSVYWILKTSGKKITYSFCKQLCGLIIPLQRVLLFFAFLKLS